MAKSIVTQKTLLKKETTPGTANVTTMNQMTALSLRPAWNVETNEFRAQGFKLPTVIQQTDEWGVWAVEGIQDFNHLGFPLASRIAVPVTTTPGGGTLSRQHVFTLDADGADALATYTAQFGDTARAVQGTYGVFQSFGVDIARGALGFDSGFISRTPAVISSIATVGVVTVPAAPTAARQFDVWADSTWAGLGTTKLLAAYEGSIDLGDKFARDTPLNSAVTSFESVVEATDQSYSGNLRLGFDATAEGLITTWTTSALKFIRLKATGPIIETTIAYSFQVDMCVQIINPGQLEAFNNGVLTLPFDFSIVPDPTTGNAIVVTLVNTQTAY